MVTINILGSMLPPLAERLPQGHLSLQPGKVQLVVFYMPKFFWE